MPPTSSSSPFVEKTDEDDDEDDEKKVADDKNKTPQKLIENGESIHSNSDSELDEEINMSFFDMRTSEEGSRVASHIEEMDSHWTIATQKDARDKGIHDAAELSVCTTPYYFSVC